MKKKIFLSIIIIYILMLIAAVAYYYFNKGQEKKTVNIPKLYITGNITDMQDKTDKRKVSVKYESDTQNFECYAMLKVQGQYTLKFDKKNYNITFYNDEEQTDKKKVDFKWGEYSKYTLKANWTEPLHARTIVTAQIASEINRKYNILTDCVNNGLTDGFPIEIYANGEFLGLYTLNLHKDYLFNMDKDNKDNMVIFANSVDSDIFSEPETEEWTHYEIEVGEKNEETLKKLNRLIDFVNNSTDEEFVDNFEQYFNKDSVLNYYCLMYFAHLIDNVQRNIFLVTYDGKVWYLIPYDFDQSWGNEFRDSSIIAEPKERHVAYFADVNPLWKRLKKLFRDEINDRYIELRKDILTKENIINKMNDFYKLIPDETLEKEYSRWNNKPNYERSYINEYLDKEIEFLDKIYGKNSL